MLKAGFAEVDITPLPGMSCTSFVEPRNDKVKTPFSVTAAVFSDGAKSVAMVGIDGIVIQGRIYEAALAQVRKQTSLDTLLCAASHTHSGGPTIDNWAGDEEIFQKIEDLSPEIRALGLLRNVSIASSDNSGDQEMNIKYLKTLEDAIVDAVIQAMGKLTEVRFILGKAIVEDVGYNRRIRMKDGFTVTHPGVLNPDSVDYAGPVDKELVAMAAVNSEGKVLGVVFNFACHATVDCEGGFSADYPYYARETIRKMIGAETVPVFLNGCCGDVTQIDNLSGKPCRRGGDWSKILGQRVGFAAVDAIASGKPESFDSLEIKTEKLTLTYREPSPKEYAAAVAESNKPPGIGYNKRWWAMGKVIMNWIRKFRPDIPCELNVVKIGNLVICSTPAETFCATGLAVKAASPFPFTMMSELTNGWIGYLPTADVFGPNGGGYEGEFKFGSYLEEAAEEKIRAKCVAMVTSLKPEKEVIIEQVKPAKAGGGWWKWRNEKYLGE